MRKLNLILSVALLSLCAVAAGAADKSAESTTEVKQHLENHFKFYGFIRNYFTYDSRENVSGTGDLFNYIPRDQKLNADGEDLNAQSSFRFLALTSRVGVDVSGYYIGNVHLGAKVEADFYSGLSKASNNVGLPSATSVTGTAALRLRQAYATITWNDLPMSGDSKASVGLKIGQAWHPMGADHPQVFSLEVAAPFAPFSRTPLVQMDANLGSNWVITGAALWQQQYTSNGPSGSVADYMKYSGIPEFYAGVTYKNGGFLGRVGVDVLSIKPRVQGQNAAGVTVKVSDRITTASPFMYLQYTKNLFTLKAKTIYATAGEHIGIMSGYAKVGENEDGSWNYAPLRNSSSWLCMSYGKKWQGVLLLGYAKNFGLADGASDHPVTAGNIYFSKNGFANLNQIYRINPEVVYNFGKLTVGLEYQYTAVQYGETFNNKGLATENLHWVANNRVQSIVRFNF
ncbi:MAG: hypothetical protein IKC03_08235 [Oscillospiraceae bacterium]|nr:hypothetical protein [Oscillospiraceae bacterium]